MFKNRQKRTGQAIIDVLETGRVLGDYGRVAMLPVESGHLGYGRPQATLTSGLLFDLIQRYTEAPGAWLGMELSFYLARLKARDLSLDSDSGFQMLLLEAGGDPTMREMQDQLFDDHLWSPAVAAADGLGLGTALGVTLVCDAHLHGSWAFMRDRATQALGSPSVVGERVWVARCVEAQRAWLAVHGEAQPRPTATRMDAFLGLMKQGKWELELPLTVRGVVIDEIALAGGSWTPAPEEPVGFRLGL